MPGEDQGLFIPAGLRPPVGTDPEEEAPLAPGASKEEIRRRAEEALGPSQCARLGLDAGTLPPELWQRTFLRSAHVNATVLEKEAVLLNLANGVYYTLNPMGTAIWELLAGDRPLDAIPAVLCERFDVDEERARADLAALVTRLRQERLIEERR